MLSRLSQELETPPAAGAALPAEARAVAVAPAPGRARDNPVPVTFLTRRRLNKEGSLKETWHVELDIADSGLDYVVGDSLGLYPANDPALVDAVIAALAAPPDFPIGGRTLREVLIDGVSLAPAPDMLFRLISYLTGGERRQKAIKLAAGQDPDGDAATLDVLAALQKFPGIRPDPEAFVESLDPLQPRVYSISSSPKCNPGRVSLTVDAVRYRVGERMRHGVASTLRAEGAAFRAARGSRTTHHHDRPRHRDRAVPRLPAGAHGRRGAGTQLALFRSSAQRFRFLLRGRAQGHAQVRPPDAPHARLVARRQREDLRASSHARGGPRSLGLDRARRAYLCMRRRAADGQGRGARTDRHRRRARQTQPGGCRALRRRAEEERPLPDGCVLMRISLIAARHGEPGRGDPGRDRPTRDGFVVPAGLRAMTGPFQSDRNPLLDRRAGRQVCGKAMRSHVKTRRLAGYGGLARACRAPRAGPSRSRRKANPRRTSCR